MTARRDTTVRILPAHTGHALNVTKFTTPAIQSKFHHPTSVIVKDNQYLVRQLPCQRRTSKFHQSNAPVQKREARIYDPANAATVQSLDHGSAVVNVTNFILPAPSTHLAILPAKEETVAPGTQPTIRLSRIPRNLVLFVWDYMY